METTEQDVSELFRECGIERQVVITLNEHMYTLKTNAQDNWLFYTFFGFKELHKCLVQEGKVPKRMAIIGTGNGLDALGAYSTIDGIEQLLITDIDQRVIGLSRENVEKNIPDCSPEPRVHALVGDLCKPFSGRNLKVDLVYANLPNLPSEEENINEGYKLSSLYKKGKDDLITSKNAKDYLLAMQELFLHSAKGILNPGGSVLSIIGGRVPYELFSIMFSEAGFRLEELCSGFKRQTEPEIVIPEYANAERDDVEFSFYHYAEVRKHLKKLDISNPTTKIDGMELSIALRDYRVSAREALNLYRQGTDVGHTVHFFRGIFGK